MKDFLKKLTLLGAALVAFGFIVVASGVVPVKASGGHWPITTWVLDFASNRSISTHSVGIEVPPLDEPGMLTLGAGIYESNCTWCHGRPGLRHPRVAAKMTPTPPYLPDVLHQWEANEKFYVVKHGIKFAGMPAWPTSLRDDEIWPLVAFLERLDKMSVSQYEDLLKVNRNTSAPEMVIEACAVCHTADGSGQNSDRVPILSGQNEIYLRESLQAFANGDRHSGVMEPIAARLSTSEIGDAAKWYAEQQTALPKRRGLDDEATESVRQRISQQDNASKMVDCLDCHDKSNDPSYPKLAGQPAEFLERQLALFRERRRGGAGSGNLMHKIADTIDEKQAKQIAGFFASLPRESETSADSATSDE